MMDEKKMQQIASELTLAGTDPQLRERIERLERRRITPDKQLPEMEFLFRLFGKPCFPRGELVGITGKAKSGKTFVTSMLMTCCFRTEVLSFVRPVGKPYRCLWFDTEQSEESTQDIMKHRIARMVDGGLPMHLFDVFNVRADCWQERLPLLEAAIGEYLPDLVVLDGIRDLVNDINDGVMAQDVIERLMHLASDGACCIVCVLHQNKSAEDRNLRGWIGTELMNKAFEVYACEKLLPQRIFTLEQTHTRKYDIVDTMYYTVDEDGIPESVRTAKPGEAQGEVKKNSLPELNHKYIVSCADGSWQVDVQRLFRDALGTSMSLTGREMRNHVMTLGNIVHWKYYNQLLEQAIMQGVVVKSSDQAGHVIYTLPENAPY